MPTAPTGAVPAGAPPLAPPASPEVTTTWVTVGGLRHRVLTAGAGWPVVLLHGIGGSADEFLDLLPRLGARVKAIAPDAPGHGFADKPSGRAHRYDVAYYAEFVRALLDALGIQRAPLVAVSGAGPVALALALEHPHRVSKLVLVDAAGLGREVSWTYRAATLPLGRFFFRRGLSRERSEAFGRRLCYNPDRLPAGWADRRMKVWATEGAVEAFFATVRAGLSLRGQRVHFLQRLRDVRHPTLIVWGRQDPIIPVTHAEAAARVIPNARLRIFDACGHMPLWEYPDEFTAELLDFLG